MADPTDRPEDLKVRRLFDRAEAHVESTLDRLPRGAVRVLAREVLAQLAETLPDAGMRLHGSAPDETDEFCDALLSGSRIEAQRFIARLRADGVPVEDIYTEWLAPAAVRLGERWEKDQLSFAEVGQAITRLYTLAVALRRMTPPKRTSRGKRAVFATVPGDEHTLGITMAADIFRRAGWEITLLLGRDHESLVRDIQAADVVIIGLSAGTRRSLVALVRLIVALRLAQPGCAILVSGQIAQLGIDLVGEAGADVVAETVESALTEMERLSKVHGLQDA